jgi:neuronal guanine nucleotide exchange factor
MLQKRDNELSRSSGSLSLQPSSSSQEEAPPVPLRKVERKSTVPEAATAPVSSAESGRQTPPIIRRLKPSQREGTPPTVKKPPRRPPPTPPLSPSPPPVLTNTKTVGRSSNADTNTADPASAERHNLFSSGLSSAQINDISKSYEVFDNDSKQGKELEKLYQKLVTEVPKETSGDKSDAKTPCKPRRHHTHYELTFLESEELPPLLKRTSESSGVASPMSSDAFPPPLPSQPIPKRKDRQQQPLLKRDPIQQDGSIGPAPVKIKDNRKESDVQPATSEPPVWSRPSPKDPIYDVISDVLVKKAGKMGSPRFLRKMVRNESRDSADSDTRPESPFRRETKSFSAIMLRRSNSDRFKKNKVMPVPTAATSSPTKARQSVHRTPSVDKLDDRMERSVKLTGAQDEDESSSDDEETVVSPTQEGLPQPPLPRYTEPPKAHKMVERSVSAYVVPADEEPLYQYINTAEFLRTPQESVKTGLTKNQLDIARQLSSRRLWCEQPEIIQSGVLESLSEDEKKLQEAIFEVVTTEATYLRSLDVLIHHFMEDPGMNPNLPEGRRVLDKRQHHVIFSNVQEVRETSARFLEELRARQKGDAVIKGIADIVLEYAEKKFDCYVRYCTNQIYQTRELQQCIERNVMFREYLRRLEKHKRCQHLSMMSFLLLPMQRITRLPLLILAILNKTPLDHEDHGLVENSLRTVQKLVTECNDGARKMERTEQLHNIHQQLDFGKLKPFPLVSTSRQLERKGTIVRLQVEQKLFGRHQIKRKQTYVFVFTDMVVITKRKKDQKGDFVYKVVDYASRAVVEMEDIGVHPGMTFPKHTFGEQDTVANATWAVSTAGEKHAFLLILLDNVDHHSEKYIFVAQNDTDKTRWMESLATPESQREDEKIYQTWDCPQVQAIYDYKAAQPDELSLERGDVVKVYRKMGDGWYEGEKLRDLQWGWFPSNFTTEIANEHTRARNLRETHRLLSLPYSPEEYVAKITTIR